MANPAIPAGRLRVETGRGRAAGCRLTRTAAGTIPGRAALGSTRGGAVTVTGGADTVVDAGSSSAGAT